MIRTLLYGNGVDRNVKARARVGFTIIAFVAVYATIAGKLLLFGITSDSSEASRRAAQDATATARPDILDRNGAVLATDVKASSLFGEPRRLIDRDEAVELLTGTLPEHAVLRLQARSFTVVGKPSVYFEVDGELGHPLPAKFSVQPAALRVLVP